MAVSVMTTQWNTKSFGTTGLAGEGGSFADDEGVILLQGKNTFGDRIYSYLKITVADFKRMQSAILSGQRVSPSDFGSVVAAGKGDPTPEVKAEINSMYKMIEPEKQQSAAPAAPPVAPKAWDEY